jgi:hypothetical protein
MNNILKRCKIYESKITAMMAKKSASLADIHKLRIEVNQYTRERVIFDNVFHKFEYDIKDKQDKLQAEICKTIELEDNH